MKTGLLMDMVHSPSSAALDRETHRRWIGLLLFVVSGVIFLDYWGYSTTWRLNPAEWSNLLNGRADAPAVYRIGVVRLAWELTRHGHWGMRHAFALFDLVSASVSVLLLYSLLQQILDAQSATRSRRLICNALLVSVVCFYLMWLGWAQRPETLPSLVFVVATLFLSIKRLNLVAGRLTAGTLVLLLAAAQGAIRADIAVLLHAGVLLVALFGPARVKQQLVIGWRVQVMISALALLFAGAIQLYIARWVFPLATYGNTPVMQLMLNVSFYRLVPFVLFMWPVFYTWVSQFLHPNRFDAGACIMGVSGSLYLLLWVAIGSLGEVRIFLPFAIAISPWTVSHATRSLGWDE